MAIRFVSIALVSLFSFSGIAQAAQSVKSCVFYFERLEHPFWPEVKSIFSNQDGVVLYPEAKPVDILECLLTHNPQEILLFAHAIEVDSSTMRLGFYSPVDSGEAARKRDQAVKEMQDYYDKQLKDPGIALCQSIPDSGDCRAKNDRVQSSFAVLHKIKNLRPNDELYKLVFGYGKGIFFQKPFQDMLELVTTSAQTGSPLRLKKIRLMSCEPKKIYKAYPALEKLVKTQNVRLDIAPGDWFQSLLSGKSATTINKGWLRKSLM